MHRTLKKYNKKMGSPCLFLPCMPVILSVFCWVAWEMFETWSTGKILIPEQKMEVGWSRIWGLVPLTQTQVGGTPHKPALPATLPRAPPATPDPRTSTRHTEQWVEWKKLLKKGPWPSPIGRGGRGNTWKHTSDNAMNAELSKTTSSCTVDH